MRRKGDIERPISDRRSSALVQHVEDQPAIGRGQPQAVGALRIGGKAEAVLFDQVIDGDAPLVLGLGRGAGSDGGIEFDRAAAVSWVCRSWRDNSRAAAVTLGGFAVRRRHDWERCWPARQDPGP